MLGIGNQQAITYGWIVPEMILIGLMEAITMFIIKFQVIKFLTLQIITREYLTAIIMLFQNGGQDV